MHSKYVPFRSEADNRGHCCRYDCDALAVATIENDIADRKVHFRFRVLQLLLLQPQPIGAGADRMDSKMKDANAIDALIESATASCLRYLSTHADHLTA